ncbi:hypothetical protein E0W68_09670 [Flavobacterium salilacus subsp. salilacus]|uniref:hypothetical protein n=1 Tax=Flavobacterium TaxID=237 RepID=UPI0010750C1A|nr:MULTISPECIES: hypothetical protein [Flavobacterium]KAF2518281.1 hypothetical protein E0W68_09670 [Flavobacterium salilacus subsp. salilacus]MBE1615307.1 hypothetical protein [Flavobacterium sp. SaA2.13]
MMENSINIDLRKFKKIEDIIFLDEPILSHLKYNETDYFLYLVDTDDKSDFYCLFEIDEEKILKYFTKEISLRDLILKNKKFIYLIQEDFSGNTTNINIVFSESISDDYLPAEESYLNYTPTQSSYYYKIVEEYKSKQYLQNLREDAFYLKFASTNLKYADTIGLNELTNELLSNLTKSFKNFLKIDFFASMKDIKSDKNTLNKLFNRILPDLDFRMVDLKWGSFEIGLAVDSVMKSSIENKQIKDWAIEVGSKYKNLVLDEDYDDAVVDEILATYDEEDRRKIFEPIFKITENPNFDLKIKKSKDSKYSTIKIKDKRVIQKILPIREEIFKIEDKDFEVVQFTTVIDKNSSNRAIKLDNTLFVTSDMTNVVLTEDNFKKYGFNDVSNLSIPVNIFSNKSTVVYSAIYDNEKFEVTDDSGKIDDQIKRLVFMIYEYIVNKS